MGRKKKEPQKGIICPKCGTDMSVERTIALVGEVFRVRVCKKETCKYKKPTTES